MIDRSNALWFKDAIIYEAHVKSFYDANSDGTGDFAGLTDKLDYLQDLGVTALWLLPFYPSPQRDDGYDIARYMAVNQDYGPTRDFRRLLRECHDRGIRLITELVMNHTSDEHPWFKRARRAKPGSVYRNFYVWSQDPKRYSDARVIFCDVEKSNWSYDEVAGAYFWHRFYSHQPDLNYDNPRVLKEMMKVMNFWLDMGVDGLRLDAIPYLVERENTNCENLPETHDIIRHIRAKIDKAYPDRVLIAEANQWPEDVAPYFGDGDECHMCYHFPLMPRFYMAIAQEDRHPITDIMRQTPEIPANCSWAMFLRNHDELTLEMVTERERDYLWSLYAGDKRARLNLGIRRRLAPLLGNDRAKIELLNSLLFSMPGTPIIYYGDEIGMGDNVYLGDRNGVRTPMQWSSDRNGGFSRCDPERLYLPVIMDSVYGYHSVNVEAQRRSSSSLLNWMKRILALRKQSRALSGGLQTFLYPSNRKILAYLRQSEDDTVLCIANLSRSAQAVELDLSQFKGRRPVEMLGRSKFPRIGELPYLLTLPSYGFFWFSLPATDETEQDVADMLPEYITLVFRESWKSLITGREGDTLRERILPQFVAKQRWFAGKDDRITQVGLHSSGVLGEGGLTYMLLRIVVTLSSGDVQTYFIPLAISSDEDAERPQTTLVLAKVRRGPHVGLLFDATASSGFPSAMIEAIKAGTANAEDGTTTRFVATSLFKDVSFAPDCDVQRLGHDQSNTSIRIGDAAILKIFRKLEFGLHPEIEMARYLTEDVRFPNTPPLLGYVEYRDRSGELAILAAVSGFVRNQGDGWQYTKGYLDRFFDGLRVLEPGEEGTPAEQHAVYLEQAAVLGRRTAELHRALARPTSDPAFASEPLTAHDSDDWRQSARAQLDKALKSIEQVLEKLEEPQRELAKGLLARREEGMTGIDRLIPSRLKAAKTRIHGDYHLGQVLVVQNDFWIVDFEGEPTRSLADRHAKHSPLRDVAGMLRSFDYAAWSTMIEYAEGAAQPLEKIELRGMEWRDLAQKAFLECYAATIGDASSWPEDPADRDRLLMLFLIEKAAYEIVYESANRPTWLRIPMTGLTRLLDMLASGWSPGQGLGR